MILTALRPTAKKPGHRFVLNADFASAREQDYDAPLIPGGRAPEYLRLNEQVIKLVQAFDAAHKPDCRRLPCGLQLLAAAGILKGRTCSAYRLALPKCDSAAGIMRILASTRRMLTAIWSPHPPGLPTRSGLLNLPRCCSGKRLCQGWCRCCTDMSQP